MVTGTCLAEIGHEVSIFDIDSTKLKLLQKGEVPIHEPGLEKIFKKNLNSNGISIQPNPLRALDFSDAYFVCVGTPQFNNGKPNLKYLYSVCRSIKKYIIKNDIQKNNFIVLKSTIPPGTIADINSNILVLFKYPYYSNPEFLREGKPVFDFIFDRIVIAQKDLRAFKNLQIFWLQTRIIKIIICIECISCKKIVLLMKSLNFLTKSAVILMTYLMGWA